MPAKIVKFLAFLFLGTAAVCAGNLLLLDPTRVRDVTPETGRIPLFDGQQPTSSQGKDEIITKNKTLIVFENLTYKIIIKAI